MSFSPEEIAFLSENAARISELAATLPLTQKSSVKDAEAMRAHFGEYGRAAMELATAQKKNQGKLPASWLISNESAQQATPLPVAEYRARKIKTYLSESNAVSQNLVHDVTCSIGTEGAALLAEGINYLGSDLDHERLLMARANLAHAATGHAGTAHFLCADALHPVHTEPAIIVADPARRAGGRRIVKPEDLMPPLPALIAAYPDSIMAIKCAPGLDFHEWDGLVSLVSVDGNVKEACLYSPQLSHGVSREAVMISSSASETDSGAVPTALGGFVRVDRITNEEAPEGITAGEPGKYIIDPDGAVVRAGLVKHYAAREGLWMLDERIAYLTGDRIPAGKSGFEFREMVPIKKLKAELAKHDAKTVEILVRGVDVDPDQLRKKLKLKGTKSVAVVLTRIGSQGVALICGPRIHQA